jgi:hypothetical protein
VKIEKDPSGKRPFLYETRLWTHFGEGEGWEYARCNRCIEHVYSTRSPSDDTVNCWKVLVFKDAVTDFEQVKSYLLEGAKQDTRWLGKFRRDDALAVVYSTSEPQRNAMKGKIYTDLKNAGLLKKDFLPYRRGCKAFEKVLGPWREWKAGEVKFPESRETANLQDTEVE